MTVDKWSIEMDQMASSGQITLEDLARWMRTLEARESRQNKKLLSPEKVSLTMDHDGYQEVCGAVNS